MANNRLPLPFGRLIDRQRPIAFRFAGSAYGGLAGDTIASALIANGIWAFGASSRRRRPRGIHALGESGAESWVALPDAPHVAADTTVLRNGMAISPGGPGRRGMLPSLPATGRRTEQADRVRTEVAVIGGGPAGVAAAIAAADAGRTVVLVERLPVLGGSLLYGRLDPEGRAAPLRRDALLAALAGRANVQVWTDAACVAVAADRRLDILMGGRRVILQAGAVVLATGCTGQKMVFRDNDLPGVIQARTAEQLIHLYGVRPGARVVVATTDGAGLGAALTLLDAGVEVPAVLDILVDPGNEALRRAISARGVPVFRGHTILAGLPTEGGTRLGAVVAAPTAGADRVDRAALRIMCEALCVSSGWHPAIGLAVQAGGTLRYDAHGHRFAVDALPSGIFLAGAAAGASGVEAAELDGLAAGDAAVGAASARTPPSARPNLAWPLIDDPMRRGAGSDFVDMAGDVTRDELGALLRAGLATPADMTAGRRTDPGDAAVLHRLLAGGPDASVTERIVWSPSMPVGSVTLGEIADPLAIPSRHGPLDRLHRAADATMAAYQSWLMPSVFAPPGAAARHAAAVAEEVHALREHIGLMDRSDLGKVIVSGEAAAGLLDRTLTGRPGDLAVGSARLVRPAGDPAMATGAMVAARLGDEDFLLTAHPERAPELVRLLREAESPEFQTAVVDITAGHAILALAGPNAPSLLASLGCPAVLLSDSTEGFGVGATRIAGIGVLILRTAAVGEPTFELIVAAGLAAALWTRIVEAGARQGLRRVGRRAERRLRLEHGLPPGIEVLEGLRRTMPGRRFVQIGFTVAKPPFPAPDQLVLSEDGQVAGRVLAAVWSSTLARSIGLAAIAADSLPPDGRMLIAQPVGPSIVATATADIFYTPVPRRPWPVAAPAIPDESAAPARQSPVHDRLVAAGARFVVCGNGLVAASMGPEAESDGDAAAMPALALLDLSTLPRLGFAGPGAPAGLLALGLPAPTGAAVTRGGGLIGVLIGSQEALALPDPETPQLSSQRLTALAPEDACPGLLRGDMEAWFLLRGAGAANCLESLGCGVDGLSRSGGGGIARATLWGCETLLISEAQSVHLLVETSLAHHVWDGICRLLPKFGGRVLGLAELPQLR